MLFKSVALLAAIGTAVAQRPMNTSICDYYTTALLKDNNATNQYTLLTLLVNTVVIGNYTQPNKNAVPGILAPGNVNGTAVNLAGYFNGGFASSNRGGSSGIAVNFLDGGGAAPLMMNKPANDNTSNQYKLLTHLYEYFGVLLGCSMVGMTGFPAYDGQGSQYNVHKFMALDNAQVTYFIQQVGLAAQSFGVTQDDIKVVAMALSTTFDEKCAPAAAVVPAQGAQLQAICIADDCMQSPNATCSAYGPVMTPMVANATLVGSMSNSSMSMSGSGSMTGSMSGSMTGSGSMSTGTGSMGGGSSGGSSSGSGSSTGSAGGSNAAPTVASNSIVLVTLLLGVLAVAMAL